MADQDKSESRPADLRDASGRQPRPPADTGWLSAAQAPTAPVWHEYDVSPAAPNESVDVQSISPW